MSVTLHNEKSHKSDVKILSATEGTSEDATSVFMEGFLESMAEYYECVK